MEATDRGTLLGTLGVSVNLVDVYEKRAVSGPRTVSVNIDENTLAPLRQFSANDHTDIDPGDFYAPGIAWRADFGVVPGCGPDLFCPNRKATRAEAALFINGVAIRLHIWGGGDASLL